MATFKKTLKADLCLKKPDSKLLDVGDTSVVVDVVVDSKKPLPSSKTARCVTVAEAKVADYAKVIQAEVTALEAKVREARKKGDVKLMESLAGGTTLSVQNACRALQAAVQTAVAAMLKKEAQGDQNLLEAKVGVGIKIGFKVISIASSAARLAVTAGADLHAWKSIVTDIKGLGETIYNLCKGEQTLRKELLMAIGTYCTDKQRRVIEEEKAAASKKAKFVFQAKEIYRRFKPEADKAEAARKKYRDKVTDIRHDVDNFFGKVDKADAAFKSAPTIVKGAELGAQVMVMKRAGRTLVDNLAKCQGFAEDMAALLTEAGVKIDDSTFVQRLKSLAALPDLAKFGHELRTAASQSQSLVENVMKLAGT